MLGNTPNQPSKFRAKNWVEINDGSRETCNTDIQIKWKTAILKFSLCDFSDANILFRRTMSIPPVPSPAVNPNDNDKDELFNNSAAFTDCINRRCWRNQCSNADV